MSVKLNILVDHSRYFVGDGEFVNLKYSGSYEGERQEKVVSYTIQMTENNGEVNHGASPPIYKRTDESFESVIDTFYSGAAAQIQDYFQTTYPDITFELGIRVNAPQLIQNEIDQALEDAAEAVNSLSDFQGSTADNFYAINAALSEHATDTEAHSPLFLSKQNLHANLTALSSQILAPNKMLYADTSASFSGFDSTSYGRAIMNFPNQSDLQTAVGISTAGISGSYNDLSGKPSIPTQYTDEMAQDAVGNILSGSSGSSVSYNDAANTITISSPRATSSLSLSLVGTGATGTQINATKDSLIKLNVSTSTTSTIGGPSTSLVSLKICATDNVTEGSWTTVATLENDQTITLAIALNSIQVMKGQLIADVPAGWFAKLVNSGTGTHSEAFISGQQTIYG